VSLHIFFTKLEKILSLLKIFSSLAFLRATFIKSVAFYKTWFIPVKTLGSAETVLVQLNQRRFS